MLVLTAAGWMMAISLGTLLAALLVLPWLLARLPADYFAADHATPPIQQQHPVIYWSLRIAKNLFGGILVVAGLILVIPGVPGQGLLTLLIGVLLMDFPGKRRIELSLIRRPRVLATVNSMRHKLGQPPLQVPEQTTTHKHSPAPKTDDA